MLEKIRVGGKLHRKYDEPRTPYQRLTESAQIPKAVKRRLQQQYESMNVAELRRQVETLRSRLFQLIEGQPAAEPSKPKHRRPDIRLGRGSYAWMAKMMKEGSRARK